MEHHFSVEIAKLYGIEIAIFLNNISFWIKKNIANGKHHHDGNYWVYNSQEAFTLLFPYWKRQTIRTVVTNCLEMGLINKGNYNSLPADRTTWYSLTQKGMELFPELIAIWKEREAVDNLPPPLVETNQATLVRTNQALPYNKPDNKIKSFSSSTEQQKPKPVDNYKPPYPNRRERYIPPNKKDPSATYIDRNTMSDEYKKAKRCDPAIVKHYLDQITCVKWKRYVPTENPNEANPEAQGAILS